MKDETTIAQLGMDIAEAEYRIGKILLELATKHPIIISGFNVNTKILENGRHQLTGLCINYGIDAAEIVRKNKV